MRHDYSQVDAEDILKRAVAIDALQSHNKDVLLKTAAELGISAEAVEQAEREHFQRKVEQAELREFISHQRQSFWSHLASYVIVNAFLAFIDLKKDGHFDFVMYPLMGWGIGIAFHAMSTFNTRSEDFQNEFEQWRASKQKST